MVSKIKSVLSGAMKNLRQPMRRQIYRARIAMRMRRRSVRLVPSFLIIGAMRAGTTSLMAYLARHPRVARPLVKEIHFFDHNWHRSLDWYLAHFSRVTDAPISAITGEASPYYLPHPRAPERVSGILPNVKFVVLLRNPIARAISHYYHEVQRGCESRPIGEALRSQESMRPPQEQLLLEPDGAFSQSYVHHSYVSRGFYAGQLRNWFSQFDRNRFLIISSEHFFADPRTVYLETLVFLGLDEFSIGPMEPLNAGSYRVADGQIGHELGEIYRRPNQELYELLQMDLGWG